MYHHIEATKRITNLLLFKICLAEICGLMLKTSVILHESHPIMAYYSTEYLISINVAIGWFLLEKEF